MMGMITPGADYVRLVGRQAHQPPSVAPGPKSRPMSHLSVSCCTACVCATGQQVFTSSGTFQVPQGITRVSVMCVGAGGGAGSWRLNGADSVPLSAAGGGGELEAISFRVVAVHASQYCAQLLIICRCEWGLG
jgi:hypothetical protein